MRPLVLVALAACAPAASAGPAQTGSAGSDVTARFEHDMLVRMHMHENFGLVRAIEHLLVRGKLDDAKELARGISQAPDEPGSSAWATSTALVRDRAAAIAAATTVDEAVHAVARLGTACAECHIATGTTPDLAVATTPPVDTDELSARMTRHRWATDRLWEGLIAPSDEIWSAGLDVLAAAPLPASELGKAREPLARKLQRTADRARTTKPQDRAQVYGDMLATCAACHTRR
jgi:mono/diheme cytochrome c family protein